jgi:hypothetical protein
MARVSAYVGTFTKRSGTGTQDITGVGFTPKALVFWTTLRTAQDGFESAAQRFCFGFSDGTNHAAVSHASASGGLDTAFGHRNDCCLLIVDLDESVNSVGVVSALSADGFTVNWTTAAGHANVLINFLAIGGTNVSAKVGDVVTSGSTGTQSVTGVGFEPDLVLFLAYPASSNATEALPGFGPAGAAAPVSAHRPLHRGEGVRGRRVRGRLLSDGRRWVHGELVRREGRPVTVSRAVWRACEGRGAHRAWHVWVRIGDHGGLPGRRAPNEQRQHRQHQRGGHGQRIVLWGHGRHAAARELGRGSGRGRHDGSL